MGRVDVRLDALVGQNAATVDVDLVTDSDVVAKDGNVLEAGPAADCAVPADNGALDPGVIPDLGGPQQDAALQTDTVADNDVGANGHIGTYPAVLANLGSGVDQDVAAVDVRLSRERLVVLLGQGREVQTGAGQEVLGLTDVHPVALQVEGVQLALADHGGEGLLLDRCGAELDAVKHRCVEDVEAGVDAVADELDRLLNEAVDARGVAGLVDNDTVLGGLLDLGDNDSALIAVRFVELDQLLKREFAGDVGVEDEEGRVIFAEDILSQLQGTSSAQRLVLDREGDVDVVLLANL